MKLTYKQAYDRLTEAYIEMKVNPFDGCACFVGNLLQNSGWPICRVIGRRSTVLNLYKSARPFKLEQGYDYTNSEITQLEKTFMVTYMENCRGDIKKFFLKSTDDYDLIHLPIDEDALFLAFEKGLDELRQIHINGGENVDEQSEFKKRQINETINV